jgi:hypothetical protein
MNIRELTVDDAPQIKNVLLSRDHVFTGHSFDYVKYSEMITSPHMFTYEHIKIFGLFEDDGTLDRLCLVLVHDVEQKKFGVISFHCSVKKTGRSKNQHGWSDNFCSLITAVIEYFLANGVETFSYVSPIKFKDDAENEGMPIWKKFTKIDVLIPAGSKTNNEFIKKYIVGDDVYTEDVHVKTYTLVEENR